ncbi:hypothetical protein HN020_09125 [Brevibacillus borstelensis]|uniref:hypothetical protein n=1 Tax=Brevibacillus borstelensis TaxID=45462 RepID=UPI000469A225|nr:hypothetical protein [Brevibacillus borstelensis]NOU54909.1 hypothetical protein [Brevibacillus borstelensis]
MIPLFNSEKLSILRGKNDTKNLTPEILTALEALAAIEQQFVEMQVALQKQSQEIENLKAELSAMKGGGQ